MLFARNQKGVMSPMMLIVIVVVVAAIGFAGWKVSQNKKDNSTSSGSATVLNSQAESECNKEINDKTFCKFVGHFTLATAYKMSVTNTDSAGKVTKMNLETDGTNSSSVLTDENGKESGAFVSIGNDSYIKDEASGSWTKYTSKPSDDTNPAKDIKIDTSDVTEKNTVTYKNVGKEACGNLTCYKYQVVDSQNPGTTQYLWFDTKDYLLRRWSTKDANGSSDMTISYAKVTIKAPSPVKEATTSTGAPSQAEIDAAIQAAQAAAAASDNSSDTSQ